MKCHLCHKERYHLINAKDAKTNLKLDIAVCILCGLVQQVNIPSEDELKIYYSHNYRINYKKTYAPKLKYVKRAGIVAINRINFLRKYIQNLNNKLLLDIGAGGGEFVYISSKYTLQSVGVEPNVGYSEFAKAQYGVDIKTMMLDELESSSVDIVTMFHVLEHMANPEKVMKKIYEVLKNRGILFIEVPNILQKDAAPHNIYFNAHIFYYNKFTLTSLASKFFEVVHVEDDGNLSILFRKREIPLDKNLMPLLDDVKFSAERLQKKGWLEYIFIGGGILKPPKKIIRTILENFIDQKSSPKNILDLLIK